MPRIGEVKARYALASFLLWPYGWFSSVPFCDALSLRSSRRVSFARKDPVYWRHHSCIATARVQRNRGVVGRIARELERQGVFSLPRVDRVRVGQLTPTRTHTAEPTQAEPLFRFDHTKLRLRSALPLLSVAGLVSYVVYLAAKFGEPFAFATAERAPGWDLEPGPHTWFKVEFFDRLIHFPNMGKWYTAGILVQAVLGIGVLLLSRRVGASSEGLRVYVVTVLAIPLVGSKDFQASAAMPRRVSGVRGDGRLAGYPPAPGDGSPRRQRNRAGRAVQRLCPWRVRVLSRRRVVCVTRGTVRVAKSPNFESLTLFFPMWNEEQVIHQTMAAAERPARPSRER